MPSLVALAILLVSTMPAPTAGDQSFCSDATYSKNSTYTSNLRTLAGALIGEAARLRSATGAAGEGPDRVYGAVLCRADSAGADCARRLQDALGAIDGDGTGTGTRGRSPACALRRDVAVYSELYQLRFSDSDFLANYSNAPEWADVTNPEPVTLAVAAQFDDRVTELLSMLADEAAGQPGRWAVGEALWSAAGEEDRTVYALAQCTQDMPPDRCRACLDGVLAERLQKIGSSKMGAAVFGTWCTMRYEMDLQFFNVTGDSKMLFLRKKKDRAFFIIATVYTSMVLCTRLFFWLLSVWRKKKRRKMNLMVEPENVDEVLKLWRIENVSLEFSLYDFSQIVAATDNFSPKNILGEGGFGPVYKGVFPDGQEVAIKRLSARSRQGLIEFKNEIQVIAKLQHKNLVRLLGCCIHEEEKIRASLKWNRRIKIIEGIAQGLLYLHNHSRIRIIHRDLKASNILLDSELNPKISDFGMARIFPSDATQQTASRLAWQLWKDRRWNEFIDQSFGDEYKLDELMKYLAVALMCVQEKTIDRPTMPDVVAILSSDSMTLPEPKQPAYIYAKLDVSVNITVLSSKNDVTITTTNGRYTAAILVVAIGGFLMVIFISCLAVHVWIKTQQQREQAMLKLRRLSSAIQSVTNLWRMEGGNLGFSQYDYSHIKEATNNFSVDNRLGQGGFGPVYKGRLSSGVKIAVKRLETCSLQGLLEFQNEIQLIAKLQHKNLVKLLGYCTKGGQEKMLIYEYMENKNSVKAAHLNWSKRLHIIDGIAQGLLYLHKYSRLCIVHRDLKASNILLDSGMNPKISDFGMARIFSSNVKESNTTRIVGTHGYIPPEYAFHGVCSTKSDVFSYGVLTLEILSSKRTAQFYEYNGTLYNLISYAWQLWSDGKLCELVYSPPGKEHQEIERHIHVALLCVQESAEQRPHMEQVVTMLNAKDVNLPKPMQPAYFHVNPSQEEVSSCSVTMTMSITLESNPNTMACMPSSSAYTSNLKSLAEALIDNVRGSNSHSTDGAAGTGPDSVYGAVLCRGDTAPAPGDDCASHLNNTLIRAAIRGLQRLPEGHHRKQEADGWRGTDGRCDPGGVLQLVMSMAVQNVINLWRIEEGNSGFSLYDFSQIKEATSNFSSENKLGEGGFGPVYKGLLPGGLEVAVKRLAACSVQGLLEFKNEIQLIAKLQHKNLVRLLGCCIQG
ncbi:hypothetical protein U9M48_015432 [Paspalum notatum var. saurae]|uniref:non-specific serine/threonine protein kinase n=1 Tax=Paspalum notatum var. saurae TaxID=547442 RepID=A0AAQ3T4W3_PASNO